jgi:serine/threonine-protein kinase
MVSARDVDSQADIWALGVVLYELLTGTRPFLGESLPEIAIKVATASFAPIGHFRSDIPAGLEAVVLKCLEKERQEAAISKRCRAGRCARRLRLEALPSIDRAVDIIRVSGLSPSSQAPPPSALVASAPGVGTMTAFEPQSSDPSPLGTMAPSATTAPGARRRSKVLWIAGTLGVGLVVVMGLVVAAKHPSAPLAASARAAPSLVESAAPPAISAEAEPQKPAEPFAPTGASATIPTAAAVPASQSSAKCNPPYFIDSAGHRQYKPECL